MQPDKKFTYDWDAELRKTKNFWPGPEATNQPVKFDSMPATLAWLQSFASEFNRSVNPSTSEDVRENFPWLWNPDWDKTVPVTIPGVKQLKGAAVKAEALERSLDSFLLCVKDRITRIRRTLNVVAAQSYFPLLSDDVLAMIFEFAALPFSLEVGVEYDNKATSMLSQVCSRFRDIALGLPNLWRFIDINSNVQVIASRSEKAGAILEAQVKGGKINTWKDVENNVNQCYSFMGRIVPLSSRISYIRFDLFPGESGFWERLNTSKEFDSLSFPSLDELVLNFECTASKNISFYKHWDMPVLRVIEGHNVIPVFRSNTVYAGIAKCSLKLDGDNREFWTYPMVIKFLSLLSGVKTLDILLRGQIMKSDLYFDGEASLPTVLWLRTAFPETNIFLVQRFCHMFKTPNKTHWILDIEPDDWAMNITVASSKLWWVAREDPDSPVPNLKELELLFRREFRKRDCAPLKKLSTLAHGLERLTVTYVTVTEQLRRFEVNNCKDKLPDKIGRLEESFGEHLGPGNAHFVLG
ncbi:hypothetical protein SCHPADRAFT_937738 [Schizopora paradoxa]|uniref:F-box domain-containing protein n=1 Tax=Schizopora paradoxa TaxID=27342 RepID=A0A0H2S4V6_9AGAM|nr:hypothetical protein SCHPADRAFT_937738 [Schizopora paradoxa]